MTRQTSIDVYREIEANGLLSARRFEVYDALYQSDEPLTQNEVHEYLVKQGSKALAHSISPRFAELRDLDAIEEVGVRECRVTGREVLLWQVTGRLPRKRRLKRSSKLEKLRRKNARLEAEVVRLKAKVNRLIAKCKERRK